MPENQQDIIDLRPQSTFRVLDFDLLPERLSTDEKFRAAAERLCEGENLNLIFPRVLNYKYAPGYGPDYFKRLTAFPAKLLDSDTYTKDLELRGPIEEIILETNSQRGKYGLPLLKPKGEGWSSYFMQRLEEIKKNVSKVDPLADTKPTKTVNRNTIKSNKNKSFPFKSNVIGFVDEERDLSDEELRLLGEEPESLGDDEEIIETPHIPNRYKNRRGEIVEGGHILPSNRQE